MNAQLEHLLKLINGETDDSGRNAETGPQTGG